MAAASKVDLLDLSQGTAGLYRDGSSDFVTNVPGPPRRVSGLVVGAPVMNRSAPHGGEMHPDGDELLYLVSGSVSVVLELPDEARTLEVGPGQAVIVPKGVWHRVVIHEPSQLVHLTPGPGGEHRPPSADTA